MVYLEVVAVVACDTEGQQVFSALQGHFLGKGDVFYCACFLRSRKVFSNMVLVLGDFCAFYCLDGKSKDWCGQICHEAHFHVNRKPEPLIMDLDSVPRSSVM